MAPKVLEMLIAKAQVHLYKALGQRRFQDDTCDKTSTSAAFIGSGIIEQDAPHQLQSRRLTAALGMFN